MTDARDLRLGNWFSLDGKPVMVSAIHEVKESMDFDVYYWYGLPIKPLSVKHTKLEGLPINRERLEAIAFRFSDGSEWSINLGDTFLYIVEMDGEDWAILLHGEPIRTIHYVHEIQDLYFALSGSHLDGNCF